MPSRDVGADLVDAALLSGRNSVQPQQAMPAALHGKIQPSLTAAGGSSLNVSLCRTAAELSRTLERGSSLQAGVGPLPILKARQEFFDSLQTTVFSVSLVVQARRVIDAVEVLQPRLRSGVTPPSPGSTLDDFVAQFGDSFVNSLVLGGEVQGVYTYYAQSREQARQVERAFGGGLRLGGLTFAPELSRRVAEVSSSNQVNTGFKVMVRGLRDQPELSTPESLVEFAGRFGSLVIDDPQLLQLDTRGYETVPELREAFLKVAANRILFSGDSFGPGLLRTEQQLQEVNNQCKWVKGTYSVYGLQDDPSLEAQQQQIKADLRSLVELKRAYLLNPAAPLAPPNLTSLATGSPRINVQIADLLDEDEKPMGGGAGQPFTFVDRSTAIQSRRRLAHVGLRAGSRIDQIRLTYERDPDAFSKTALLQESHGGTGGRDLGDLVLGRGVSIASIKATTGTRVDMLTLTTSDGQSIGGGGNKGDRSLDWKRSPHEVLLGFSGRAASELDGLQPVVARFEPLVWEPVEEAEDF